MTIDDEFVPTTVAELQRFLADNATGPRRRLCPIGGRTALAASTAGTQRVDLRDLHRVIDYPARDLTVTVEAGVRIATLQQLLATERQQLPIDIAQPERATLGGALASNTSGPRRYGHGTFRDAVIGIAAIDAAGRHFHGGGRVVKNVAGYDLCKLLVGSRGTLAVITQVTLKLKPLPEAAAWWWLAWDTFDEIENVLERLMSSAARPTAIELLNPPAAKSIALDSRLQLPALGPVLALRVEGSQREVAWQLETLRKEIVPFGVQSLDAVEGAAAEQLTAALTDFPVCADDPLAFQANLFPSECCGFADVAARAGVAVQCHAGNGIVIGQLPEETGTVEQARELLAPLHQRAHARGGNLQILHCDPEWQSRLPMSGQPEPAWGLMSRLKMQLDPQGLLNPLPWMPS